MGLGGRLRPEEWLFLTFSVVLIALMIYLGEGYSTLVKLVGNWRFGAIVLGMCAAIFLRGYWRAGGGHGLDRFRTALTTVGRTLREFSPLWACMVIYETLHDLTPVLRPHVVDQQLIAIDHAVVGVDVARWLNDHIGSPAMTEVLVVCYASYGFATPIYAAVLYLQGRMGPFRDLSLAITITAFIGYLGYMTVPAVGPYVFQTDIYPDLLPQWGHNGLLDTINQVKGTARDCFPSLHTAMTTVLLTLMWRDARRLFWAYLPIALGLYLSTLYLRVHYGVDVAAGLVTAILALILTPRINRWWHHRQQEPVVIPRQRSSSSTVRLSGAATDRQSSR
ncbi:MAG: phosphatase family protein [Actinomycetia bacterium]|nr:phosphatase family protein [Actinomycetes bacterium]